MTNLTKSILSFTAGVVAGIVGTIAYNKYKDSQYTTVVQREPKQNNNQKSTIEQENNTTVDEDNMIEELKDTNYVSDERVSLNTLAKTKKKNDIDRDEYEELLTQLKYKYTPQNSEVAPPYRATDMSKVDRSKPYIISPDEFMEFDDWESDDYTYYMDGYVTDSVGTPVTPEDVDDILGLGFERGFGLYADDEVWIRNERLRMDFSVALDADNFADIADDREKRMLGI